jgi:hypothetical protein
MTGQDLTQCPNCENSFDKSFEYCPHCGQRNKELNLSFRYFVVDFISSSLNLDSKIFTTLRVLIFSPGKIATAFLSGKRTMYIPPVRLYLIVSLVYFTLLSLIDADVVEIKETGDEMQTVSDTTQYLIDTSGSVLVDTSNLMRAGDTLESSQVEEEPTIITMDNIGELSKLAEKERDSARIEEGERAWFSQFLSESAKKLDSEEGKREFQSLIRKYISIGMFVLMPVTALIFFLLFYRGTYYIQHLVFVLYLQSMMYLLFTILNVIELVFSNIFMDIVGALLFLSILCIWIKRFYLIGWVKTLWKTLLFLVFYGFSFMVFLAIVAAVSAWNL